VRDAVVPSACVDDPSVSATLPTRLVCRERSTR
jgi:hypothetical protein